MRALTVKRPWPLAFLRYGKRVENRSWPLPPTLIGEPIALHAGKGWDEDGARFIVELTECCEGVQHLRSVWSQLRSEPYLPGSLFAVAAFRACVRLEDLPTGFPDPEWAFGPECWLIGRFSPLILPVQCRGYQGLWTVPESVRAEMRVESGGVF